MKWQIALLMFFFSNCSIFAQAEIELKPNQSMHLIGKGPGQESVINPYSGYKSAAIIRNIGDNPFDIRIHINGEFLKSITIEPNEKEEIILKNGYELYIDGDINTKSTAQINFRKL